MRIAIRADASTTIGTGHVMRCIVLANALREQGGDIVFLCREEAGDLRGFLKESNIAVRTLPNQIDDWQQDVDVTLAVLDDHPVDWLIVDHYRLDAQWEQRLRARARNIMVVDDLANRPHDCDILLDQNFYTDGGTRYDGLVPSACGLLLGPDYALLRSEFVEARSKLRIRDGSVGRILIFFGGSDPTNETAKALDALAILNRPNIVVDVVVGSSNPNRQSIEEQCNSFPSVSFHCQIKNMSELMVAADLFIGAGGSTTWERCCLGLPGMVVTVADNQVELTRDLADAGHLRFVGKSHEITAQNLLESISALIDDKVTLRSMAESSLRLVDGLGVARVVAFTTTWPPVTLRCATLDDELKQFAWRNAPEVRSASFDDKPISLDEHQRWFRSVLDNPSRHLLIAERVGEPIGVLRYDVTDSEAEVSIFMLPGLAGQGLGTRILQEGTHWLQHNQPQLEQVRARILPHNHASQKAFCKAGYVAGDDAYLLNLKS